MNWDLNEKADYCKRNGTIWIQVPDDYGGDMVWVKQVAGDPEVDELPDGDYINTWDGIEAC